MINSIQKFAFILLSILIIIALHGQASPTTTSAAPDAKLRYNGNKHSNGQRFSSDDISSHVTVQTTSGILKGSIQVVNVYNHSVLKFLSVPYAEAPVGRLRFQRPVELKDRGSALVDASKFGKTCPQYRHLIQFISPLLNLDHEHQISEDCLHLHVYVPDNIGSISKDDYNKLESNKQLPVIVWLPGEGYHFADARQFDGSHLAYKTQSIVVSVQYRVGVLGFLHAPKHNIHGNMGLHDQIMALKWINKNIHAFGGDANRVTLMGRFSGAMSISALMTAPKPELLQINGKPLFNQVALLSGVAVEDWIIDNHPESGLKQIESKLLKNGLCSTKITTNSSCLMDVDIHNLMKVSDYGWRLVVDNELVGKQSPVQAIENNHIVKGIDSVLMGTTAAEGTLCLYRHMMNNSNNFARLIEENSMTSSDLYNLIQDDSQMYFKSNNTQTNLIGSIVEAILENDDTSIQSTKLRSIYLNVCSAYMVKSHVNRFKRGLLARNKLAENRLDVARRPIKVYHYELKYKPSFSLAPDYINVAAHGDDIPLLLGLIYQRPRSEINDTDLLITRKMMAYVGNFVHGNDPLLSEPMGMDLKLQDNNSSYQKSQNENETYNIDYDEYHGYQPNVNSINGFEMTPNTRNSWPHKGQVHMIDISESDNRHNLVGDKRKLDVTKGDSTVTFTTHVQCSSQA